ncbi:MAG: hypothetical protein J6I42_08230, partial [Clostridia bacterium]|nr:hypothetical protein [Clostridia bacterium]
IIGKIQFHIVPPDRNWMILPTVYQISGRIGRSYSAISVPGFRDKKIFERIFRIGIDKRRPV